MQQESTAKVLLDASESSAGPPSGSPIGWYLVNTTFSIGIHPSRRPASGRGFLSGPSNEVINDRRPGTHLVVVTEILIDVSGKFEKEVPCVLGHSTTFGLGAHKLGPHGALARGERAAIALKRRGVRQDEFPEGDGRIELWKGAEMRSEGTNKS